MTEPAPTPLPELLCQHVIWRVAKFEDWMDKQRTRLTPRAFKRQSARGGLPAEEGVSVVPEGTCSPEQAVQNANGGVGIGTLLVGHVTDLGMIVQPDRTDHALILGMPLAGDPGNEDDALGMHLRAQLSKKSRVLNWRP